MHRYLLHISLLLCLISASLISSAQFRNDTAISVEQILSDASPEFLQALNDVNSVDERGPLHFNLKEKLVTFLLKEAEERRENTRLVASILTLTLGPFGAHRLYLGTEAIVPIFYTATLGGGLGILPVVDLFHILLTKDLSRYYNNPSVFMWGPAVQNDVQ